MLLAALFALAPPAGAVGQQPFQQLLTTHPAADYNPSVSPDGKWLVFTSDRNGAPGLFVKSLDSKGPAPERELAPHPSKTDQASFSPDGRSLVLTSFRDDALGDVFLYRFPDGPLKNISRRGQVDQNPSFTADGKAVVFESGSIDGEAAWFVYTIEGGVTAPAPPGLLEEANLPPYPVKALDRSARVALLFSDDTSGDDELGEGDNPTAWEFRGGAWLQSSLPIPGATGIAFNPRTRELVIAARWLGQSDIATIGKTPLRDIRDSGGLLARANSILKSGSAGIEEALACHRSALLSPANEEDRRAAALGYLATLNRLGRVMQASSEAERLLETDMGEVGHARVQVQYLVARQGLAEKRVAQNPGDLFPPEDIEGALRELLTFFNEHELAGDSAECHLQLARVQMQQGNFTDALAQTETVLTEYRGVISEELAGRTILLRADVYTQLGLGPETQRTILSIFESGSADEEILGRASDKLIALSKARSENLDVQVKELRDLGAASEKYPWLFARVKLEEGRLLWEIDSIREAEEALAAATGMLDFNVAPSLTAASELAELQARDGRYSAAIATARRIEKSLHDRDVPAARAAFADIRDDIIRYHLDKARNELALGDPLLALATCRELTSFDPTIAQAWRMTIRVLSTDNALLNDAIKQYERETASNPRDALAWYKLGLALSYRDPASSRARRAVDNAITQEASEPLFYLLRGFLNEQLYRKFNERGTRRNDLLENASLAYEQAISLDRAADDPTFRADVLLNSGNAALELRQYFRALSFYRQRAAAELPFDDPRTELLFHWNTAVAAYQSGVARESAEACSRALATLDRLAQGKLLDDGRVQSIREELTGRSALALMEAGDNAAAEKQFALVEDYGDANSLARVRAMRNRAFLKLREAREAAGSARLVALANARELALRALDALANPSLRPDRDYTGGGALINFTFVFASDPGIGAGKTSFDKRDEERLLRSILASIYELEGERERSTDQLTRQIALEPKINDENRAYYYSARAVTLSRIAQQAQDAGAYPQALAHVKEGLSLSRFQVSGQEFLNTNAATLFLLKAAELLSVLPEGQDLRDGKAFWMLDPVTLRGMTNPWELLDSAAEKLANYPDPTPGNQANRAIVDPTEQSRLMLVRIVASNRLYEDGIRAGGQSEGLPLLERTMKASNAALRARRLADLVTDLSRSAPLPREAYRLAALGAGAAIRLSLESGDAGTADALLKSALAMLDETGQPQLRWWMVAQAAVSAREEEERQLRAGAALKELLALPVNPAAEEETYPGLLFDELEAIHLRAAIARNDLNELWTITDQWRVARLRWLLRRVTPESSNAAEQEWLRGVSASMNSLAAANKTLRDTPASNAATRTRLMTSAREAQKKLDAALDEGGRFPVSALVNPQPLAFGAIEPILEPPFLLPDPPVLLLNRTVAGLNIRAVYTPDETRLLEAGEEPAGGSQVFVFGESPAVLPAGAIEILSDASFYGKFRKLSLPSGMEPFEFPGSAPMTALALSSELRITPGISAAGAAPQTWTLPFQKMALGELFQKGPNLEKATLDYVLPAGSSGQENQIAAWTLAAWLDARGIVEATINGRPWLGMSLDPRRVPALAEDELAVARTSLSRALESNKRAESAVTLERVIALKEALNDSEDLQLYYGKLAEVRGQLGRWSDATKAAARRIAILDQLSGPAVERAQAMRILADISARARDWPVSFDAYEQARALYREIGDKDSEIRAIENHAVALENAGRYEESIRRAREARQLAEGGDPRAVLAQDLRIARVLRVYLSRYDEAEEVLRAAADFAAENNVDDLAAEAQVNLARTLLPMARFEEAEAILEQVQTQADAMDSDLYRAQVLLERANLDWLRSDYFSSFTEQQKALALAITLEDIAMQVAIRNVSGLTSWAVNDTKRAWGELLDALALARETGVDAETASTCNNLGLIARSESKYDEALAWFQQALDIDTGSGNLWGEAYAQRNIGITFTLSGRAAEAISPLTRAVELCSRIGDEVNLAKSRLALGDAQAALGSTQSASTVYTAALEKAKTLPLPEVHWRALHGLGMVALAEKRREDASALLAQATDVVDQLRASIRVEEFQDGFLLDKQDLYNEVVQLHLDMGNIAAALEASEKSRGRNFVDLLGNKRLNLGNVDDQALLDRERVLRANVETLERKVGSATEKARASFAQELARARQEYSDLLVSIRASSPQLASFLRVEPITAAQLQSLVEPDTRILVYHLLPRGPVCWVVGRDSLELFRLPITTEGLEQEVQGARLRLQNVEPVEENMQRLQRALIGPLLPALAGAKRLCIVPQRELHTLPFAPLSFGGGEHLIDRFAIYYSPSASVLRYTIARREQRTADEKALAVGNPDIGSPQFNLPFAQKEAERIEFDFPGAMIRTGSAATETWLVDNLHEYGIIHIASHGEYNADAPLFSAVQLAPDQQNDGRLTSNEVFGLQLRADLVALSACQTGLGRISNGDDIIGLNRAFVYAGTRQLMTTLWRVDDISTAVLFKYFYRNVKNMDRAEALRQAQIRLKNRPEFRHPVHWSGLVLSGDWE